MRPTAIAVALGLFASGITVAHATDAAFNGTYSAPQTTFNTGSLTLNGDVASGSAIFATTSNLLPGATGTGCIVVTYSGSSAVDIRVYASQVSGTDASGNSSTALTNWLKFSIDRSSSGTGGGGSSSCSGYSQTPTAIYSNALLSSLPTSYQAASGSWTPNSGNPAVTQTYRITYTLDPNTPSTLQGYTASVTFRWDAY